MSVVQPPRHFCNSNWLCIGFALLAFAIGNQFVEAASFRQGDIFSSGDPYLFQYRPDGTIVRTFDPTGGFLEGATITSHGKLVTTRQLNVSGVNAPGVSIFDAAGNEFAFDTPQVEIPGDVSVFSDGTLAVSDQGSNDVDLYSPLGVYLGSISHPVIAGNSSPFGSAIGPDDTLWIAMFSRGVARFSRDGGFLGSFVPFEVQELAVDPVDGTLWIPSPDGMLHHFTESGSILSSFQTAAVPPFMRGVAVAADQTVYVTSSSSSSMYHYTPDGQLIDQFKLARGPLFISVATVPEPTCICQLLTLVGACLINSRRER